MVEAPEDQHRHRVENGVTEESPKSCMTCWARPAMHHTAVGVGLGGYTDHPLLPLPASEAPFNFRS